MGEGEGDGSPGLSRWTLEKGRFMARDGDVDCGAGLVVVVVVVVVPAKQRKVIVIQQ